MIVAAYKSSNSITLDDIAPSRLAASMPALKQYQRQVDACLTSDYATWLIEKYQPKSEIVDQRLMLQKRIQDGTVLEDLVTVINLTLQRNVEPRTRRINKLITDVAFPAWKQGYSTADLALAERLSAITDAVLHVFWHDRAQVIPRLEMVKDKAVEEAPTAAVARKRKSPTKKKPARAKRKR